MIVKKLISKEVLQVFNALNNNVRFVGGAVRDAILKKPVKDIDLATPLTPGEVTALLKKNKIKVLPTGVEHGTVTAVTGKKEFQITTLRNDEACDGRHAKVSFTDDWREDAARRDFTINAMSMDIAGNVYDYFGGQADLKKGLVRFIGEADKRVKEDYLRILRFFRFYSGYGKGKPDAASLKACVDNKNGIEKLSGERIFEELIKILASPKADYVLSSMSKNDILSHIIPGDINLKYLKTYIDFGHEKTNNYYTSDPLQRLAHILSFSFLEKEEFEGFSKRLKLSNKIKEELAFFAFPPAEVYSGLKGIELKKIIRKIGAKRFNQSLYIKFSEEIFHKKSERSSLLKKLYTLKKFAEDYKIPLFPVSGNDLMKAGIPAGKEIGLTLKKAEKWWEEGEYKAGKKEILQFIKN